MSRGHWILCDYTLGEPLRGSRGKFKLATDNITGEKVFVTTSLPTHLSLSSFLFSSSQLAVKIVPRIHISSPSTNLPNDSARQAFKDPSMETWTSALREASLSMLLHHPYICSMREMIVDQHHYYMVCEYVNGGQLLDYIVTEPAARKFARQIGSALSYCHRNNVVHRSEYLIHLSLIPSG